MYNVWNTSKLTLELREIVTGENAVDIWNFDYPCYYKNDEKKAFENKVIEHFYFHQIGFETVGRFLHQFRAKIREIMPYYLQMYKTIEIMDKIEDPFGNVDITETFEQESTGTSTGDSTDNSNTSSTSSSTNQGDNNKKIRFSDTPQGSITNINSHLTTYTEDSDAYSSTSGAETSANTSSTSINQSTTNGTVKHTFTKKGNQGVNTYAHDMIEYRKSLIDVDMMIIADLDCLFLKIY